MTDFGNPDLWTLIQKTSSPADGWVTTTKAMEIAGAGCLVRVSTGIVGAAPAVSETMDFVPGVHVVVTAGIPAIVAV